MSHSPLDAVISSQRAAAHPAGSAWVSANAGSGKTRVLTDRVIRLLLDGNAPSRILCLTFTKAAAAEMSNRLFDRLGGWAAASTEELQAELRALLGDDPNPETLARARRLFALALETPGGLKIQTLHGFAESVLGRFPLEAGISPAFEVADDQKSLEILTAIRDRILTSQTLPPHLTHSIQTLTSDLAEQTFDTLMEAIIQGRAKIARALNFHGGADKLARALRLRLGLTENTTEASAITALCQAGNYDELGLTRAAQALHSDKGKAAIARGEAMLTWLRAGEADRRTRHQDWLQIFLTKDMEPRSKLVPVAVSRDDPAIPDIMQREQERLMTALNDLQNARLADRTAHMLNFAEALLRDYQAEKNRQAVLDYDDLILLTANLLENGSEWVLYKLDGGIDHILVDEAQDTAPAQWDIVSALSGDFFHGESRRELARTVFAVGDEKQSIYSFQGAEPAGFDRMRRQFSELTEDAGLRFQPVELTTSFRSAPNILAAVDQVFAGSRAKDLTAEQQPTHHIAIRDQAKGLVEIWPLEEPEEAEEPDRWAAPLDQEAEQSPRRRLARSMAARISSMIRDQELIGHGRGDAPRPVTAGDIMILVRRRDRIVPEIVRALKDLGVPVAGADRMQLGEQIAIMDLVALGNFLLLPEDDLSLACALKSPLYGLTDEDLFDLSYNRPRGMPLWRVLSDRAGDQMNWQFAQNQLTELMARVDRMSPYSLFAHILGPLQGRRALASRLGSDIHDPLDEFLAMALDYEHQNIPDLQGFLHHFQRTETELKRDMDQAGNAVRIMTVHASKGLEAPVVFLPDTCTSISSRNLGQVMYLERPDVPDLPSWAPARREQSEQIEFARNLQKEQARQEMSRLLYVAMTRAEDQLIIGGFYNSSRSVPGPDCWYNMVRGALGDTAEEMDDGTLRLGRRGPSDLSRRVGETESADIPVPQWANSPAPSEPTPPRPLTPSEPGLEAPATMSPLITAGRPAPLIGTLTHHLLQVLPEFPADRWQMTGERLLARQAPDLPESTRTTIVGKALRVLNAPNLTALFGPNSRAEVPVSGMLGAHVISGQVDRLVVTDNQVLIADFKTNRQPPDDPARTPAAYLRQMALYRAVLRQIYPNHTIVTALVWTEGPEIMDLPDALLDQAMASLDGSGPPT